MAHDTIRLPRPVSRLQKSQAFPGGRRRVSKDRLTALLYSQVRRLIAVGFLNYLSMSPQEFIGYLFSLKNELARVGNLTRWDLPFLIAIPKDLVPIRAQFRLMRGNEVSARKRNDHAELVDSVRTPKKPYLIFDVAFGAQTKGAFKRRDRSPFTARRRGLTIAETIALAIQEGPKLLACHHKQLIALATHHRHSRKSHPLIFIEACADHPDRAREVQRPADFLDYVYVHGKGFANDTVPSCRAGRPSAKQRH